MPDRLEPPPPPPPPPHLPTLLSQVGPASPLQGSHLSPRFPACCQNSCTDSLSLLTASHLPVSLTCGFFCPLLHTIQMQAFPRPCHSRWCVFIPRPAWERDRGIEGEGETERKNVYVWSDEELRRKWLCDTECKTSPSLRSALRTPHSLAPPSRQSLLTCCLKSYTYTHIHRHAYLHTQNTHKDAWLPPVWTHTGAFQCCHILSYLAVRRQYCLSEHLPWAFVFLSSVCQDKTQHVSICFLPHHTTA